MLTLIDTLGRHGGAERLAVEIATRLDPERFRSTVCVSRWPPPVGSEAAAGEALEKLAAANVDVLRLHRGGARDTLAWRPLVELLRRERIDVLHAHKFGSNVWGTLLGRLARVPVVVAHEHSWSYEGQPVRRWLDRRVIARWADVMVAVSGEDRRRMTEVEGISPRDTVVIPNGVVPRIGGSVRDVRAELGLAAGAPVIATIGTLKPQKAFEVLVEATAQLAADRPDLRVLVIGEGAEREMLQGRIEALGVGRQLVLLGYRGDAAELLSAADIAVCCSDWEGMPVSVLEYMGAGLPVVATAVGGVPDLVTDGVGGLLVPPRDPAALARSIAVLLGDPRRRQAMGAEGRRRVGSEFHIDTMVRRLESLYVELLRTRGRTSP